MRHGGTCVALHCGCGPGCVLPDATSASPHSIVTPLPRHVARDTRGHGPGHWGHADTANRSLPGKHDYFGHRQYEGWCMKK